MMIIKLNHTGKTTNLVEDFENRFKLSLVMEVQEAQNLLLHKTLTFRL